MNEEEKKAIEKLEQMQKFYNEFFNNGVEISTTLNQKDIRTIIQILNLIQKQSKAIDEIIQCVLLHKPFSTFVCKDVSVNDCNKYRENGGCNECIKQYSRFCLR